MAVSGFGSYDISLPVGPVDLCPCTDAPPLDSGVVSGPVTLPLCYVTCPISNLYLLCDVVDAAMAVQLDLAACVHVDIDFDPAVS